MKRFISLIMMVVLVLTMFSACQAKPDGEDGTTTTGENTTNSNAKASVKLAALSGPTGMGMAYLLDDADNGKTFNDYEYTVCASPDEITGKVISGGFDIAALPTNAAATLYNKSNGKIKLLALNTECVLYILEKGNSIKSFEDLRGKTIYVSGQGATPEYILNYLLEANGLKVGEDVKLDFTYAAHNDLVAFAASGKADVVLLPEPAVTGLLAKNKDMRVALDINEVWDDTVDNTEFDETEIAMGCVVVNTAFLEKNPDAVRNFLKEYEASINKVTEDENLNEAAKVIAKVGIVPAEGVAKTALPRCNITFETGAEMKSQIEGFYKVLFGANPSSVGGKMPDENFYYAG